MDLAGHWTRDQLGSFCCLNIAALRGGVQFQGRENQAQLRAPEKTVLGA